MKDPEKFKTVEEVKEHWKSILSKKDTLAPYALVTARKDLLYTIMRMGNSNSFAKKQLTGT